MADQSGQWYKPTDKLPPVLQEVPLWINGRHMVGYYNGIAWFSRRGILPKPPMHWFERAAGVDLPVPPSCAWQEDDPNGNMAGTYASACGELWSFTEGGVAENNVRFCHGCGKPVNVIPFPQPPEEAAEDGVGACVTPKNDGDALLIDNLFRACLGRDSIAIDNARMALRQRMNELRADGVKAATNDRPSDAAILAIASSVDMTSSTGADTLILFARALLAACAPCGVGGTDGR